MDKKFLRVLFVVGLAICFAKLSFADEKLAKELANQYLTALRGESPEKIRAVWKAIDANQEVKEYLRASLPKIYESFELQGIAFGFQDLRDKYFGGAGAKQEISPSTPAGSSRPGPNIAGQKGNSDLRPADSNQRQASNQEQAQNFSNRSLQSNTDAVRNFSNKDQTSNRDLIRSRQKSLR